ncbi:MAG: hypothetical protein ACLGH3_00155 [Actinomycetota bacterium]
MPSEWDRRTPLEQRRIQNLQLKQTVLHGALAYVPLVRARLATMGKDARLFKGLEELPTLPLTSRRDVFDPRRNPEGSDGVLLQGSEEGVKRFSDRATLRKIAFARLIGGETDAHRAIASATRPIHTHLVAGPGGRVPVGYTRDDLDLLARAGARLAQVIGIDREDRIANLVPAGPNLNFWGIHYMGHGLGAWTLHLRRETDPVRPLITAAEQKSTVLFVPSEDAVELLEAAAETDLSLATVRTLVLVGGTLGRQEHARIAEAMITLDAPEARVAGCFGVPEGRVLWGTCPVPLGNADGYGFHTLPDMDVVEVVDPETGALLPEDRAGELVVTPLGFRGGSLPRWRSGALISAGINRLPCPNCQRTVPRIGPAVVPGAWHDLVRVDGRRRWVDLTLIASAAAERAADWLVEHRVGDGLFVHLTGVSDPTPVIELFQDLDRIGMPPTQIVGSAPKDMADRLGNGEAPWRRLQRVELA